MTLKGGSMKKKRPTHVMVYDGETGAMGPMKLEAFARLFQPRIETDGRTYSRSVLCLMKEEEEKDDG